MSFTFSIPADPTCCRSPSSPDGEACNRSEKFILVIAPEGMRHHVNKWKRGFYHIVKNAGIPIVMAKVDGRQKMTHVGQVFHLTEDAEADIQSIQEAFAGLEGINPKRKSKKKYITLEE
jgi:hypothetical protein